MSGRVAPPPRMHLPMLVMQFPADSSCGLIQSLQQSSPLPRLPLCETLNRMKYKTLFALSVRYSNVIKSFIPCTLHSDIPVKVTERATVTAHNVTFPTCRITVKIHISTSNIQWLCEAWRLALKRHFHMFELIKQSVLWLSGVKLSHHNGVFVINSRKTGHSLKFRTLSLLFVHHHMSLCG